MGKKYIIELEDENYHQYSDSEPSDYLWRVKGFNALVFDEVGISKLTPYTEPDLELIKEKAHTNGYGEGYQDGYSEGMNDYLQNPEVKEESDRAYAHGYSDAESKFSEIRKEAYEQGQKDLRKSCVPKDEEAYGIGYNEGFQCGLDLAWYAARKLYEIDWDVFCDLFGKVSVRSEVLDMFTASEVLQKLRAYEQEQEKIKVGDEVENTQTGVKFIVTHLWKNNLGEQGVSGFNQECSAFSTTLGLVVKTGRAFPEIAVIFEKMRNEPNEQIDT